MKVLFHSVQYLGKRGFAKGVSHVADKHAYSHEFKQLVKAGHVSILPRDENEQTVQASKDAMAVQRAASLSKQKVE